MKPTLSINLGTELCAVGKDSLDRPGVGFLADKAQIDIHYFHLGVHFQNPVCCPKQTTVAGTNNGAQLLAIFFSMAPEFLLEFSRERYWMLEGLLPLLERRWIRISACHDDYACPSMFLNNVIFKVGGSHRSQNTSKVRTLRPGNDEILCEIALTL
jgi:hypothetical protein